jgi:hypothetical protein
MDKPMSDLEEIVRALYESEINASISWVWDGGIAVELGDPLNGYDAEGKVSTFAAVSAAFWAWGSADLATGEFGSGIVACPNLVANFEPLPLLHSVAGDS